MNSTVAFVQLERTTQALHSSADRQINDFKFLNWKWRLQLWPLLSNANQTEKDIFIRLNAGNGPFSTPTNWLFEIDSWPDFVSISSNLLNLKYSTHWWSVLRCDSDHKCCFRTMRVTHRAINRIHSVFMCSRIFYERLLSEFHFSIHSKRFQMSEINHRRCERCAFWSNWSHNFDQERPPVHCPGVRFKYHFYY